MQYTLLIAEIILITVLLGGYYAYQKACTPLLAASVLTGAFGLLTAFQSTLYPTVYALMDAHLWFFAFTFSATIFYTMYLVANVCTRRVRSKLSLTPWFLLWGAQAMKVTFVGLLAFDFYFLQTFTEVRLMHLFLHNLLHTPGLWGPQLLAFFLLSVVMLLTCNKDAVCARILKEPDTQTANGLVPAAPAPAPVGRRSEKSGRCYVLENSDSSPDDWDIRIADLVFAAEGRCRGIYRVRRCELNSWLDILTLYVSDQPLLDLRETNQGNWTISWRIDDRSEELCYGLVKDLYVLFR